MKAYIINIELEGSDPLIWRKIIMPAGATYRRLHDVIQNTTNFEGGYPSSDYHLYDFNLKEENMKVTNDEEAYLEHQHYKKNIKFFEDRLKEMNPKFLEFEKAYQDNLKVIIRKPSGLKIDAYLEKYKTLEYTYDYGDDWHFKITLEACVDDYYFGFPTLLDGKETAPPEDVGGIDAYYEFLKIYKDENHEDHEAVKAWVKERYFRELDIDWTNDILKSLNYKKTQWDKINHDHYKIIDDKYRKS
jgi:hypothetical protein